MMGIDIPAALLQAADPSAHRNMASAEAAAAIAHTV
jgi:hypothetical protein